MPNRSINVLSIASDLGSVYSGKSKAPEALLSAGILSKLGQAGYKLSTRAALPSDAGKWQATSRFPNGARNEVAIVDACRNVKEELTQSLQAAPDSFHLILAGECLFCSPILSSYCFHYANKRVGMIYIDADSDLYTATEPDSTGNIAGMTLTHLTLRSGALDSMTQFAKPDGSPVVDSNNIVLFGLNTASPANKRNHMAYLFDNHFRVFTAQGIAQDSVRGAKEALKWLEERVDMILVHLDVDVIDPGEYPLGNVPNWTGLGFAQVIAALKVFLGSEKAVALSIAEVNPDHDPRGEMCARLVDEVVDGLKQRT